MVYILYIIILFIYSVFLFSDLLATTLRYFGHGLETLKVTQTRDGDLLIVDKYAITQTLYYRVGFGIL